MTPQKPKRSVDKVPIGWYTRLELEAAWKVSRPWAAQLLENAIRTGNATMKKFRIKRPSGMIYPTIHYRIK